MDDFFKKKLDERDLPFNEAHWAAAQQLLDDRDARRRSIWWWWAGLAVIALAVVVFILVPYGIPRTSVAENPPTGPSASHSKVTEKASPDAKPSTAGQVPAVGRNASSGTETVNSNLAVVPSSSGPESGVRETSGGTSIDAMSGPPTQLLETATGTLTEKPLPTPATPSGTIAPPVAQEQQWEDKTERALMAGLEQIPLLAFQVEGGKGKEEADWPDSCWPVKKRWAVQTILGGSLPAQETQAGALLGLGITWPAGSGWGLYAEGLYRIRQWSNLPPQLSLQQRYGFGVMESVYELRANSLHYADVNAGVAYAFQRHHWHAGASASYLVGARGALRQAQKAEAALDFGPVAAVSQGWISPAGLSRWLFRVQAGYGFELYPKLQLAGRVQYSVTPVLAGTPPDQPRLSPVSFDLMLKYQLW